jgi:hypothetical protein
METAGSRPRAERIIGPRVLQAAGLGEHSFYQWRKRLRSEGPVSFALVEERKAARAEREPGMLELALNGGERLRIPCEEAALELVLRVVRALR